MKKPLILTLLLLLTGSFSGCSSLIFGNIKPFEEKSQTYSILDLSKENSDWTRLSRSDKKSEGDSNSDTLSGDSTDVAFVSHASGSTISLNSTCKNYQTPDKKPTLRELSQQLVSGSFAPNTPHWLEEKEMVVQKVQALKTISQGVLNRQNFQIETVVLQFGNCIYDMIYVSRVEKYKQQEKDFSRFVSSLQLR
jgi:hypothetical protein